MSASHLDVLVSLLREHGKCVVLTGAGVSTESGIPDFRSPVTGLYESIDPMEYLSVQALRARPEKFWKYFTEIFESATSAEPNAGHRAIARLEERGYVSAVVTQNIDGLHQKAGSRNVLEVHGHLRSSHCDGCRKTFPLSAAFEQVHAGSLPVCADCTKALRPDVVLFGDMMPDDFRVSIDAARSAGLVLVVGSSLTVSPANSIALEARRYAIINRDFTMFDDQAIVAIHAGSGETLTALVERLL